jgi:hypothetical protein
MATSAILGSGTLLKRGDGASPEVFTTIFEVVSIGDFGQENPLVEATHMQSSAREYIYGLPDGVEVPVVVNYKPDNTTHINMLSDQANRVTRNFKLVLPTSPAQTFSFSALVRSWRLNFTSADVIHASFTLKISGVITGPV